MRRNKTHILNEVSTNLAGKALKSAIERIKRLSAEFAESDFKDTEILAKLQKLALQRNRFTDYINDANNEAADQVAGPLKRVIKKWSSGRTLSNGTVFKPLFTLKSDEVKTREVVKQRWGSDVETYKKDIKDIPFSKLIVIGLNSDFDALIKAGKKYNMDYSQYELLHDEYDAINDELKNDLLAINGISYSWSRADRRNKRNPYDTITMVFYIDTKLIDTEIMSQKLGGYSFYDTDYRKTAGSCGGTQNGIHYSGVPYGTFKTRRMELHADEKLNNEKKDNKALYEKIMRNVSREIKKALNENITDDITVTPETSRLYNKLVNAMDEIFDPEALTIPIPTFGKEFLLGKLVNNDRIENDFEVWLYNKHDKNDDLNVLLNSNEEKLEAINIPGTYGQINFNIVWDWKTMNFSYNDRRRLGFQVYPSDFKRFFAGLKRFCKDRTSYKVIAECDGNMAWIGLKFNIGSNTETVINEFIDFLYTYIDYLNDNFMKFFGNYLETDSI